MGFRCDSGMCVPTHARCNFHADCNDASDEKNCPSKKQMQLTVGLVENAKMRCQTVPCD